MNILLIGVSLAISCLVQPITILLSQKYHFFIDKADNSKPQRNHTENISRGGGIGIVLAFILAFFYFFYSEPIHTNLKNWLFLCGAFLVFLSGFLEDIFGNITPKTRLLLQAIGASISMIATDSVLFDLNIGWILPPLLAYPFTLFCIVGITNAMNIIDGFNGLCAGTAIMILTAVLGISASNWVSMNAMILLGALIGFFIFNFPKGKIFLGDGGAYFIGFMLAFFLIALTQSSNDVSAWFGIALMIYPLHEVLFSIYRKKFIHKISPFAPDNLHLHALIYKKWTHNSPLTSLILFIFNTPFVYWAFLFYASSGFLILSTIIFIVLYILLYCLLYRKTL